MNKNIFIDKNEEKNIVDLLRRYRKTVNVNDSTYLKRLIISLPFDAIDRQEFFNDYFNNPDDLIDIYGYDHTTKRIVIQIKDITKINV
jgi:hypothetical protein